MAVGTNTRSAPTFAGLSPRSAATSRVGAGNGKKHTAPEMLLRKALSTLGVRFQLHADDLPGCPDLVIRGCRVAIFCDGDFWHGRNWQKRKRRLRVGWNSRYWVAKIERNRQRDRVVTRALRSLGWKVVRVWEGDVLKGADVTAATILKQLGSAAATGRRSVR